MTSSPRCSRHTTQLGEISHNNPPNVSSTYIRKVSRQVKSVACARAQKKVGERKTNDRTRAVIITVERYTLASFFFLSSLSLSLLAPFPISAATHKYTRRGYARAHSVIASLYAAYLYVQPCSREYFWCCTSRCGAWSLRTRRTITISTRPVRVSG